jgi:hypothetical protein
MCVMRCRGFYSGSCSPARTTGKIFLVSARRRQALDYRTDGYTGGVEDIEIYRIKEHSLFLEVPQIDRDPDSSLIPVWFWCR